MSCCAAPTVGSVQITNESTALSTPCQRVLTLSSILPPAADARGELQELGRARETLHSTAGEAALVAREAGVRLLALTHLSNRYAGPDVADEARQLFPDTVVPRDFDVIEIPFPERGPPELLAKGARRNRTGVGSGT